MKKSIIIFSVLVSLLLSYSVILYASGQHVENDMLISAFVPECATIEVTNMDFGSYDKDNGNSATFTVTVNASLMTTYAISIDAGDNFGTGTYDATARAMGGGSAGLSYYIYKPSTTIEWGDTGFGDTYTNGTALPQTGTGEPQYFIGSGTVPAGQFVDFGSYNDIVRVTINL